jgi:predicted thioesterase
MAKVVADSDLATFETGNVHPFYSTFALGRDVEWACRQFVLNMKEEDEEGIGTFLNISHKSPAMLGEELLITATLIRLEGNTVDCDFWVYAGERLVAQGTQGQKILKKEKVARLIAGIQGGQ